ncbi:MAG: NUDIX domain-containing protein [Actinomycetota bacterium]|nr:NUDIX domain-containing protein [Actinomycetota bacterium]
MIVQRRAARALLIADRSVLLIKGFDPGRADAAPWWLTPGGGADEGESLEDAAVREVFEETGLRITPDQLGPIVATRTADFEFDGRQYHQTECFFAVPVESFTPHPDGWDDDERRMLLEQRWWSIDALAATDETVYPIELVPLVRAVLAGEVAQPIELSGD